MERGVGRLGRKQQKRGRRTGGTHEMGGGLAVVSLAAIFGVACGSGGLEVTGDSSGGHDGRCEM